MENELVMRAVIATIVLFIILIPAARLLGEERLAENIMNNLTKASITVVDDNVKIDVRPLEDGYLYEIIAEPALQINTDNEVDAFAVLSFRDQHVRANVVGSGGESQEFKAAFGPARLRFTGEVTSFIPPLAEWGGRPLEQDIPVIVKSNTQAPVIVNAWTREVIDVESGVDLTPFETCKAKIEVSCGNDLEISRYLKQCDSDDEKDVCEEKLEVCGGFMDIEIVNKVDCSRREVPVNLFYREGRVWEPGEKVGISFWDKKCNQITTTADYIQLLNQCSQYRLGGMVFLDAGLITT